MLNFFWLIWKIDWSFRNHEKITVFSYVIHNIEDLNKLVKPKKIDTSETSLLPDERTDLVSKNSLGHG